MAFASTASAKESIELLASHLLRLLQSLAALRGLAAGLGAGRSCEILRALFFTLPLPVYVHEGELCRSVPFPFVKINSCLPDLVLLPKAGSSCQKY